MVIHVAHTYVDILSNRSPLTKIPHEHVPKSHAITCHHSCGIFVRAISVSVF